MLPSVAKSWKKFGKRRQQIDLRKLLQEWILEMRTYQGSRKLAAGLRKLYIGLKEFQALLTYTRQLEADIREQQEQNKSFASKLETLETERDAFEKQLKNMEETELPSLKKALQDASREKDAAIITR